MHLNEKLKKIHKTICLYAEVEGIGFRLKQVLMRGGSWNGSTLVRYTCVHSGNQTDRQTDRQKRENFRSYFQWPTRHRASNAWIVISPKWPLSGRTCITKTHLCLLESQVMHELNVVKNKFKNSIAIKKKGSKGRASFINLLNGSNVETGLA